MNYIITPPEVTIQDIIKNKTSFSPLQYKKINIVNPQRLPLKKFLAYVFELVKIKDFEELIKKEVGVFISLIAC